MWRPTVVLAMTACVASALCSQHRTIARCKSQDLQTVPADLSEHLTLLDVSHNPLRTIASTHLLKYVHLEVLELDNCDLEFVSPKAFQHLTNLTFVNLSNNKLPSIDNRIFSNNSKLEQVLLNGNKELFQPSSPFLISNTIRKLNIANCGIWEINDLSFSELPQLTELNLSDNILTTISPGAFNSGALEDLVVDRVELIRPAAPTICAAKIKVVSNDSHLMQEVCAQLSSHTKTKTAASSTSADSQGSVSSSGATFSSVAPSGIVDVQSPPPRSTTQDQSPRPTPDAASTSQEPVLTVALGPRELYVGIGILVGSGITYALVRFCRKRREGTTNHAPESDRLARRMVVTKSIPEEYLLVPQLYSSTDDDYEVVLPNVGGASRPLPPTPRSETPSTSHHYETVGESDVELTPRPLRLAHRS